MKRLICILTTIAIFNLGITNTKAQIIPDCIGFFETLTVTQSIEHPCMTNLDCEEMRDTLTKMAFDYAKAIAGINCITNNCPSPLLEECIAKNPVNVDDVDAPIPIPMGGLLECFPNNTCRLQILYFYTCDCVNMGLSIENTGNSEIQCEVETTDLSVTADIENLTYQWFTNDIVPLEGEVQPIITISESGCYFAVVEDTLNSILTLTDSICISCTDEIEDIPTLSQWGIIILAMLLFTTVSVSAVRQGQTLLQTNNASSLKQKTPLLNWAVFNKVALWSVPFLLAIFILISFVEGDFYWRNLIGTLLSGLIAIYLIHFIILNQKTE